MKIRWSKILRIRYLLYLMVIATAFGIIIHPEYLYKDKRSIKGEYKNIKQLCQACNIGENEWIGFDERQRHFNIFYMNTESGEFVQEELCGLSAYSNFGSLICPYYFDESSKSCYTILMKNSIDYHLIKINYQDGLMMSDRRKIFSHTLLEDFDSEICHLNGKEFVFSYDDKEENLTARPQSENQYLITINPELFKAYYLEAHREKSGEITKLFLNRLNSDINSVYTEIELNKILMHNSRKNYFKAKIKPDESSNVLSGFYGARFIKPIDGNNDGNDDLLFSILGDRFLYSKLICYDVTNNQIIWDRDFAPKLLNLEIEDVNNDGLDEIIFSSYSPCSEMPIDFKEHPESMSSKRTYITVLTNEGKNFEINNKPVLYDFNYGFNEIKYDYISELNGIIFGFRSHHTRKDKPIFFINLETNELQKLEQSSSNILEIMHKEDRIKVISLIDGYIEERTLDFQFKTLKEKRIYVGLEKLGYKGLSNILGKNYYIFSPFIMVSEDMNNCITDYQDIVFTAPYQSFDNTIYFFEKLGGLNNFSKVVFSKTFKPNPYLIIILLVEILFIALYFIVNQIISIPISMSGSSFFVVYCYFGRLYHWKLLGKLSATEQLQKHYSRFKTDVKKVMKTLSDNPAQVYKRNFLFLTYYIFEIPAPNEMEIIRRISHDLKNQLLVLKFMNDQNHCDDLNSEIDYQKDFSESLKLLTQNARTLSNFSHIDKLYLEELSLNSYLDELIMSYINHPDFESIIFIPEAKDITISLDKNLFRIAFDNLLNNAFYEISLDNTKQIQIELVKTLGEVLLNISNPINHNNRDIADFEKLGYTSKENGSGLGLSISKAIIEKHHGRMDYKVENNRFIVTIHIPIVQIHEEIEIF